jgi:hypothetical protein
MQTYLVVIRLSACGALAPLRNVNTCRNDFPRKIIETFGFGLNTDRCFIHYTGILYVSSIYMKINS